jgi:restriction system protein
VNLRGERVAVQCKNYSRPVGNGPVQEVYAGARHHRCVEAWVVSPAGYTRGALDLAKSTGVTLHDADTIHQWIRKVDRLEKERAGWSRFRAPL